MFRINAKHSIATAAVIVGALGVGGPASASSLDHAPKPNAPTSAGFFKSVGGLTTETDFMDYTDDAMLG